VEQILNIIILIIVTAVMVAVVISQYGEQMAKYRRRDGRINKD